ncbi:MAG TPA: nucleotidyltransferase domain-containing protein, partial [archaeon]|nr:nucleotidyltransferase domain-containing protein [archaeon]
MEQKNIILSGKLLEKHKRQLKELQNFVYKIKSIFKDKLVSVILIGSRARLDFNIRSDIDLILVGQWSNYVLFDRIDEIKDKVDLPLLPIDFFLYKPDEILKLIDRGNPMILQGF